MAITELSPEQRVKLRRQLIDRFNRQITSQLVNHPPVRRQGDFYIDDEASGAAADKISPTDDQLKAVRSAISEYSVPHQMIRVALEQRGHGGGMTAVDLLCRGLFIAAGVWAFTNYTTEPTWKNTGVLAVLTLIAASVIGRWLVRRIVKWAQTDAAVSTAQLLRRHPAARAITQLEAVTKIVSAPVLSITLARDAARRCYADGGLFDQIVMPYLDRADTAGEHIWTSHYRAYEFNDYDDQGDLEASEAKL